MKTVYIVISKYGVDCYSNLSKLTRDYSNLGYYQLYYKLKHTDTLTIQEYNIIKTQIK